MTTKHSSIKRTDMVMQNKVFIWMAVATGLILLVPLIAMQFTSEVNWDKTDFIVTWILLFGTSSLFVLVARKVNMKYRVAVGIALIAALFYLWAEFAVGIFTNWGS